jgi:hypothetical protein
VGAADIYFKTGLLFLQTSKFNQQDYDNADQDYSGSLPLLAGGMEVALWDDIVIGGYLGFSMFHSDAKIPRSTEHYVGDITAYNLFATAKYYLPLTFMKISPYIHADALGITAYSERRKVTPETDFSLNEPSIDITENYGIYVQLDPVKVSELEGIYDAGSRKDGRSGSQGPVSDPDQAVVRCHRPGKKEGGVPGDQALLRPALTCGRW